MRIYYLTVIVLLLKCCTVFSQNEKRFLKINAGIAVNTQSLRAWGPNIGVNFGYRLFHSLDWFSSLNYTFLNQSGTPAEYNELFNVLNSSYPITIDSSRYANYESNSGIFKLQPTLVKRTYAYLNTGFIYYPLRKVRNEIGIIACGSLCFNSFEEFSAVEIYWITEKDFNYKDKISYYYSPGMRRALGYGYSLGINYTHTFKNKLTLGLNFIHCVWIDLNTNLWNLGLTTGYKF
jgi:hypothetical protein